jgi:hypothetical protein
MPEEVGQLLDRVGVGVGATVFDVGCGALGLLICCVPGWGRAAGSSAWTVSRAMLGAARQPGCRSNDLQAGCACLA